MHGVAGMCTETWTMAAPMLNKRGDFAAAFVSGRLVVAGGLSEYQSVSPVCHAVRSTSTGG